MATLTPPERQALAARVAELGVVLAFALRDGKLTRRERQRIAAQAAEVLDQVTGELLEHKPPRKKKTAASEG